MELELQKIPVQNGNSQANQVPHAFQFNSFGVYNKEIPWCFFFSDHFKTAKGAVISLAVATRTIHNIFPLLSFLECLKGFANSVRSNCFEPPVVLICRSYKFHNLKP